MTVAGYPSRGNDILGTVDTNPGMDGIPYTTISYANGRGASVGADGKRVDVTKNEEFLSSKYLVWLIYRARDTQKRRKSRAGRGLKKIWRCVSLMSHGRRFRVYVYYTFSRQRRVL